MSELSMIDRVALAIWRKREENLPERLKRCTPDNMDRATGAWAAVQAEARAAIEAMRDPDIDMLVAGQETWMCYAAAEERSEANWRAMIDAALASSGIGGVDGR